MNELEYTLKQSAANLNAQMSDIEKYMKALRAGIDAGSISDISDWTGGFVARDVARMTAKLAEHYTLQQALRIVNK